MKLPFQRESESDHVAYKLLSLLLQYPDARLIGARDEIARAAAELLDWPGREMLLAFVHWWQSRPATALAQEYVATFDIQKGCGLYLTYAIYGDRRQRGVAMVRLKRQYAAAGFPLDSGELPDYLPIVLEFAALASRRYVRAILEEFRPAIEVIRQGLRASGSHYALLLDALAADLPGLKPGEREQVQRLVLEGPPSEQVGLEPFAPPDVMPVEGVRR